MSAHRRKHDRACASCGKRRPRSEFAPGGHHGLDRICCYCRDEHLPAKPLVKAIEKWMRRIGYSDEVAFEQILHLNPRMLRHWREGGKPTIDFERIDRILLAIDRLWFDVYDETTVRTPILTAVTYRPRSRLTRQGKPYRFLERVSSAEYGDDGPDWVTLERVRRVFEYDVQELAA